jgi:hypothetical protein
LKVIKYIPHKEINKQAWDHCLDEAVNQMIYAYSWFLDIVSPNWDALVLGNYEAIMPLTHKKRFTLVYLAQPLFTQQLGVFYANLEHMHATNDFLLAIPDRFKLIEINLNTYNIPANSAFVVTSNVTCHLELSKPYTFLNQNYSEQIKRNLKKALKSSLSVDSSIEVQNVIHLFKSNKGKSIKKMKSKSYNLLLSLTHLLNYHKALYCLGVKNSTGNYIAGAIFVKYNDNAIFLFSGANQEAKSCGAMSLLIDFFIQQNAQSNCILDFEGSNNKSLARFYLGFGSKQINYSSIKRNNLPKIIRWIKA